MIQEFIFEVRELIYLTRIQNYGSVKRRIKSLLDDFVTVNAELLELLVNVYGEETVANRLKEFSDAMSAGDWILVADLLENLVLPALESIILPSEPVSEGAYVIEPTASGWMTIKCKANGLYLHSNNDPMWEAEQQARELYDVEKDAYCIWGLGLGYLPYRLSVQADRSVPIYVYEEDADMIRLANEYGMGKEFAGLNVKMIHDPNGKAFSEEIQKKETGVFLHEPSVQKILREDMREVFLAFATDNDSVLNFKKILLRNYKMNTRTVQAEVGAISEKIKDKEIILVAAGPSLDMHMDYLKRMQKEKTILCVGTVLKKLLHANITPDYVFFLDPNPVIMRQIENADASNVPAVIATTAYWRIAQEYKGDKFLAYQSNYRPDDSDRKANSELYDTGGSVSTLILDVALKQGASSIEFIGLDLAYVNGCTHASDTPDIKKTDEEGLVKVQGNSGECVYTTAALNHFRLWIENKISMFPNVPIYNFSKVGAVIKGTKIA